MAGRSRRLCHGRLPFGGRVGLGPLGQELRLGDHQGISEVLTGPRRRPAAYTRRVVTPALKATVDQLSHAERRDLLHCLEQTVEDDFALTDEQVAELERRDAELVSGAVEAVTVAELLQRVRPALGEVRPPRLACDRGRRHRGR